MNPEDIDPDSVKKSVSEYFKLHEAEFVQQLQFVDGTHNDFDRIQMLSGRQQGKQVVSRANARLFGEAVQIETRYNPATMYTEYRITKADGTVRIMTQSQMHAITGGQFQNIRFANGSRLDFDRGREDRVIGLDYETYGDLDLTVVGLDNYLASPNFRPLIASVAFEDEGTRTFDFVLGGNDTRKSFAVFLPGWREIAVHNAGFERGVTRRMGIDVLVSVFRDSAVLSRALGAGSKLEVAAPQLLSGSKLATGKSLIRKFSMGPTPPTADSVRDDPDWDLFIEYCERDALLSMKLLRDYAGVLPAREWKYELYTQAMNNVGWPVDLDAVKEMQARYLENQELALEQFRAKHDPDGKLNLNSLPQLKAWCLDRGVRAASFNEEKVDELLDRVRARIADPRTKPDKIAGYQEIEELLVTKQILGGSSLKKLKVILDTTSKDGRLRNQYLHVGAGQTYRTSGRGVQMQNLKRLPPIPRDMSELFDPDIDWTNEDLALNTRQCFTASHKDGELIVGDFSSIESRGLAYMAGAQWKIDAFRDGKDLYKVQAQQIYHVPYEQVTKEQRQTGKVGELSCGYGAGAGAVAAFAKGMHVEMTEAEAGDLVTNWRAANPEVVELWWKLDEALKKVVAGSDTLITVPLANEMSLRFRHAPTPASLRKQHPGAKSIVMELYTPGDDMPYVYRVFHGCYLRGRNICYYKPSDRLTGDEVWKSFFIDPKTKQRRFYDVYGGKLAGILTQSFCREIFFTIMERLYQYTAPRAQLEIIGQFHDEIVFDYNPHRMAGSISFVTLNQAVREITQHMSSISRLPGFPLAAEVKHDYRYTK